MLKASLLISTVIVSAISAAATVYLVVPSEESVSFTRDAQPADQTLTPPVQSAVNSASTQDISQLTREVDVLRTQLEDANAERAQLAETIVGLNRQLVDLESSTLNLASLASNQGLTDEASANRAVGEHVGNGEFRFPNQPSAESRYDSLIAAGVDAISAEDISARQNRYQLDRLELTDIATREGWIDSDQYRERREELTSTRVDLREELGDDTYDSYLYSSGSNNRVAIESIIPGSAADASGAQAGDIVMSYANDRVFRLRELQQATRGGTRGELVDVTLDRQGQIISISVPRGPLGVTLDALRVLP